MMQRSRLAIGLIAISLLQLPGLGIGEAKNTKKQLRKDIKQVLKHRVLRKAVTSIVVKDAYSGKSIYAHNQTLGLNPASNVKLVSTATVLQLLGPHWRYRTAVYGPNPTAGVIKGDVYFVGDSDPTLKLHHLEELAKSLKKRHRIKRIDGDIIFGGHPLRDTIPFPTLTITATGRAKPGAPPTITLKPSLGLFRTVVTAKTTSRGRTRLRATIKKDTSNNNPKGYIVHISGRIRQRTLRRFRRAVAGSPTLTAHAFRDLLRQAGITVRGRVVEQPFPHYWWEKTGKWDAPLPDPFLPPQLLSKPITGYSLTRALPGIETYQLPTPLAVHYSKPIGELISVVNKRSRNFLADRLLMTAGAKKYGGAPTLKKGIDAMYAWLKDHARVKTKKLMLDTGSGLSYKTKLPANVIIKVLRKAGGYGANTTDPESANYVAYRKSLAVAGIDGTLRRRFASFPLLRERILGKTGTLTGIIALSGLLYAENGTLLSFAIVTNRSKRSDRRVVRRQHERIAAAIDRYVSRTVSRRGIPLAGTP